MSEQLRRIQTSPEITKRIKEELGISGAGLSKALNYRMHGTLAKKARELALSYGAVEVSAVPDADTIFDSMGNMIQTFNNGAIVRWNKGLNSIEVEHQGVKVAIYHSSSQDCLFSAQRLAVSL